jgi:hypothetical protein
VNPAPAHLESKLRFFDLSVGQIAVVFVGVLVGMVWAKFLCPLDGMWGAISGVYIAALPSLPVFLASQTDFDLWLLVRGALAWRRREGRFVPGPGQSAAGYRTRQPQDTSSDGLAMDLNLQALWEET